MVCFTPALNHIRFLFLLCLLSLLTLEVVEGSTRDSSLYRIAACFMVWVFPKALQRLLSSLYPI